MELLTFLIENYFITAIATTGVCIFATLVNLFSDDYRQMQKGFSKGRTILKKTDTKSFPYGKFFDTIPLEYKDQWQCFAESKGVLASNVFEFVSVSQKVRAIPFFVISLIVFGFYGVAFLTIEQNTHFLYVCFGGFLLLGIVAKTIFTSHKNKAKKAKTKFLKWTAYLDGYFGKERNFCLGATDEEVDSVLEQIELIQSVSNCDTIEKVAKLLQDKGLYKERTVEQQQKLNVALNRLMLTLAKKDD